MGKTKYFSFVDRFLPLQFFEKEPVTITFTICDQMDKKIDGAFAELQNCTDAKRKQEILTELIGQENADKLLSRFGDDVDTYVLDQLLLYIHTEYVAGKRKNLQAAAAGRLRK